MMSEATPAVTPAIEITVITPITACFRLARRYRDAMKNSNFIRTEDNMILTSRLYQHPRHHGQAKTGGTSFVELYGIQSA
jgi:hypothetical protein